MRLANAQNIGTVWRLRLESCGEGGRINEHNATHPIKHPGAFGAGENKINIQEGNSCFQPMGHGHTIGPVRTKHGKVALKCILSTVYARLHYLCKFTF